MPLQTLMCLTLDPSIAMFIDRGSDIIVVLIHRYIYILEWTTGRYQIPSSLATYGGRKTDPEVRKAGELALPLTCAAK